MLDITASGLDFAIVGFYLVLVVGYGVYQGIKIKSTSEFFVADKRLPWWACAIAFTALVLSTQDIVAYAETGYIVGFTAFNPYISIAGFVCLFIALGAPHYYYTGVYSVPEYLTARFNKNTAMASSFAKLIFLLAIMSFNTYAFAVLVEGLFGFPVLATMMVLMFLICIYAAVGGVVSVIMADVLQSAFMILGGMLVVFIGINRLGGWSELIYWTPQVNMMYTTSIHNPSYPAIGMWMGISIIIAAFYMMHQGVLQKCLAARSMNGSRLTMMVYGFVLLPLGCFLTGVPGLITRALVERGDLAPLEETGFTLAYLIASVIPTGVIGIVIAGYTAAMFSTTGTYINSSVTIIVNDLYGVATKMQKPDTHYLKVARILTFVVGLGIPFIFVQYFLGIPYLMAAFYSITSSVVPGVLIAVICGMTMKNFKAKAATASIIASIVGTMLAVFIPSVFLRPFAWGVAYTDPGAAWFNTVAGFCWAVAFAIIFSLVPEAKKSDTDLFGLVRNNPRVDIMNEAYYYGLTKDIKGLHLLPEADKVRYLEMNKIPMVKAWKGEK